MKYKLTTNTKIIKHPVTNEDVTLYQIEALKDFVLNNGSEVKKGDLGAWISKEENLSQDGTCWVYENCQMFDNAYRFGNSIGFGDSMQFGNSRQYGYSRQFEYSMQFEDSMQYGYSRQYGYSMQFEDSRQYGYSHQSGKFKHSCGFHNSSSNIGKLTEAKELIEFSNIGESNRTINYDKTSKLFNINNCFSGTVEELGIAVKKKYGSNSNYWEVITIIKSIENK